MPRLTIAAVSIAAAALTAPIAGAAEDRPGFATGTPEIRSMSTLAFGPDGVLFVGDGRGGAVFAIELPAVEPRTSQEPVGVADVEGQVAALLGTRPADVMIHDMAVHPASQEVYLAVSRGRGKWADRWLLPNDVADATVLLRVSPDGRFSEVRLQDVSFARAALPNPVAEGELHMWKEGIELRADAITDVALHDGTLYVAGLSNEEFASTLWRIPYPFGGDASTTTLEIFHAAHGEYETHAPIRTLVHYALSGEPHVLAAYLCTPLVTFPVTALVDGQHVKGRTVGEFGSGNYPLDMLLYRKEGEDRLLIANSNLPFMIVRTADLASFEGALVERPAGYTAGVPYEVRSGTGVLQMDRLNDEHIVVLQRHGSGSLDLVSFPMARF